MATIEDLQRKEKNLTFLLKIFVTLVILIGLFLTGWLISILAYGGEIIGRTVSMMFPAVWALSRITHFT
ncbi:MAG: hypothetical protein WBQ23_12560 [Bacteroidota bacterium]